MKKIKEMKNLLKSKKIQVTYLEATPAGEHDALLVKRGKKELLVRATEFVAHWGYYKEQENYEERAFQYLKFKVLEVLSREFQVSCVKTGKRNEYSSRMRSWKETLLKIQEITGVISWVKPEGRSSSYHQSRVVGDIMQEKWHHCDAIALVEKGRMICPSQAVGDIWGGIYFLKEKVYLPPQRVGREFDDGRVVRLN